MLLILIIVSVWMGVGCGIYMADVYSLNQCAHWSKKQHLFAFIMAGPLVWVLVPMIEAYKIFWNLLK